MPKLYIWRTPTPSMTISLPYTRCRSFQVEVICLLNAHGFVSVVFMVFILSTPLVKLLQLFLFIVFLLFRYHAYCHRDCFLLPPSPAIIGIYYMFDREAEEINHFLFTLAMESTHLQILNMLSE